MPTSVPTTDQGLSVRVAALETRNLKKIDFSQYGTPNDSGYDNTPALQEALADAYTSRGTIIDFSSGREWWFNTPMDSNNVNTYAHYDNVYLLGVAPDFTAQHQESSAGGVDLTNTYHTRLRFGLTAGQTWWDVQRSYRFGSTRMANLSFQTTDRINLFRLGDQDTLIGSSYRGLLVKDCIFSCSPFTTGINNDWLTLTGPEGIYGYTLPTHRVSAFTLYRGYDQVFVNCTFRNWSKAGIVNIHSDRGLFHNCRSLICTLGIDRPIVGSDRRVTSVWSDCYSESTPYYSAVLQGSMVSNFRAEKGYNSSFTPDINGYALPAEISWTLTTGSNEIVFTGGFGSGLDATDYFTEDSVITLDSNEDPSSLPPRMLYITEVETDRIVFENNSTSSYVKTSLTGNGAGIIRRWDINFVFGSDKCAISNFSIESNEAITAPIYAYLPGKKTVELSGNANTTGSGENATPNVYQPVIIASSAGDNCGGLKVGSAYNAPNHPLAFHDQGSKWNTNYREPLWYEDSETQVFLPGRGVGTSSNASRDLLFHQILDTSLGLTGEMVWCYLLSDSSVGWQLRPIRKPNATLTYWARVYASQETTISFYGGKGSSNVHTLSTGWHTITGTSHVTNSVLDGATQMLADTHSGYVQVGGENVYVAKVKINH